jgi:hypothetical protein
VEEQDAGRARASKFDFPGTDNNAVRTERQTLSSASLDDARIRHSSTDR